MVPFSNGQRKRRYRSKCIEEKRSEIKEKEEGKGTTLADALYKVIQIKERKWKQ